MKIAIVVGHHSNSKGAFSPYFNMSEWTFYNEVVKHIESDFKLFRHNPVIVGYTSRIKDTSYRINKIGFDLVIELHFNAATPQANGCETLYYFNSKKGRNYALEFSELVSDSTGIKLRNGGCKPLVNKKDRGYASVFYPHAPTILIEPFFGSNERDSKLIKSPENVACIIDTFLANLDK